ncbi:MAG TPA: gamma-glutamyltransferase family protein [Rhodoblastus sp.]|nr:gamma-glutamyltransferase family protein [Rhodoblastus sp.]
MLSTVRSMRGMVTAPHHLASEAGLRVLREGGDAIEATIAMGACLAVVYPHMTAIGGDGFWLVSKDGAPPVAIDACGAAAGAATQAFYLSRGLSAIPWRGPFAANTVAGAVSGWGEALKLSRETGGRLPMSRLMEDAVFHAENGFPVTASQEETTAEKLPQLVDAPGFAPVYLPGGAAPAAGSVMRLPALARTLKRIGAHGAQDFYDGALAKDIAADLARIGAPVGADDLARHRAQRRAPLSVAVRGARLFNFPPPTQGLASLMILALFDRLDAPTAESFAHVHGLVEATKQAFLVRDAHVGDPASMTGDPAAFLAPAFLDRLAARIDRARALPWPQPPSAGDTVWLGAIDRNGVAASYIQSIYFEYGSGCVLENTGVVWQNRGASFVIGETGVEARRLTPGRKPFHTLNPAMALFGDGRTMVYGTMGGEGQPQTQSALFTRYATFGQDLQDAITAPRWLLGKTWGEDSVSLKLESRFDPALCDALREAGHNVETVGPFSSVMGHAGAVVRRADGVFEGASDPRSDGAALGF